VRRRWCLAKPQETEAARLCGELGVSPLLAALLVNRGIVEPAAADGFLRARLAEHLRSPMLFRDMAAACERLARALRQGERIGIHGDYDVDGVSGSALLVRYFRALGSEPAVHIPHRLNEGYGLKEIGVRALSGQGARVMITVDCGGVNHEEIRLAAQLGMDVIVCDHHQVSDTPLPAHAVLNPIEEGCGFPFRGLCGAGIAFYLAAGLRMVLRESGTARLPDLKRLLDLVALGTIADVVPVVEENRVLVKHGLREIEHSTAPGVVALKAVSGVSRMSTGAIGFRLAPRLNAGGRLADARRSLELLTTDDRAVAERLAVALDEDNRARQRIEREAVDEAVARVEEAGDGERRHCIVLASPDWHPGVVGIVAARLVDRYHRPTVLIAVDAETASGRGSGRSIQGVNLHGALRQCEDLMLGFGGHPMAVGMTIDPARVDELADRLESILAGTTAAETLVPSKRIDAELPLRLVDERVLGDLDQLEPYGPSNPEPTFLARQVRVLSRGVVGSSHLKLFLQDGGARLSAIGFGMADREVAAGDEIEILYRPRLSEWGDRRTLEVELRDLRRA
jgi:single-stranded-DNA-specific exonuclease